MMYQYKGLGGAIALGILGLVLIWKGISGDVIKTIDRKAMIPRWMYVLGGSIFLIFPATWIIVRMNN